MTFSIAVDADVATSAQIITLLRATADAALHHQNAPSSAMLTILLTDDAALQQLNRTYRGIDKVTDVLSFEDGEPSAPGQPVYLGDIAIALPQAARQAARGGHAVSAELQLLTVHGVLHLLGYDHATAAEKAAMWAAQAAILTAIDAPIIEPVE